MTPVVAIPSDRSRQRLRCIVAWLVCVLLLGNADAAGVAGVSANALAQIRSLQAEKQSRTPAQQKLDSQLIYAARRSQGRAIVPGVANLVIGAEVRPDGKCLVDIHGAVARPLLEAIVAMGGEIRNSSARFGEIRALVRLDRLEQLA